MEDIYSIAFAYRAAIMAAKLNGEFNIRGRDGLDRMSYFPRGCCDDSCDLLAQYLSTKYGIHTKQGNGRYRDKNPNNTTYHAWLVTSDNTIIDITADQFVFFSHYPEGVYVGPENPFYKRLEDKQIGDNYDIIGSDRLSRDYKIIRNYLT